MKILIIILVLLAVWSLWGYVAGRVEQAVYVVVREGEDYEIRRYESRIEAQVTVEGPYERALNEGFRIIANYIFGGNTQSAPIAMTAPVTARTGGESIAMTAPVFAKGGGAARSQVIAFVMPGSYTLADLPRPVDSRVRLVEVPAEYVAVREFSWYWSTARIESAQKNLLAALMRDGIAIAGMPAYAGYNPPFTPPWLLRNEVLVPIEFVDE